MPGLNIACYCDSTQIFLRCYCSVVLLQLLLIHTFIQHIVRATQETTVTQRVSHRPTKMQSLLWSQIGRKRNIGQRALPLSRGQPATQTNRDPNSDKALARFNHPTISETYRCHDVFGYELQFSTVWGGASISDSELKAINSTE